MDVDRRTFEAALPVALEAIRECDFVAVDMELSGLTSSSDMGPAQLDTLQRRWEKAKDAGEKLAVLQVGVSAFRWAEGGRKLVAEPFNFWVYPRSIAGEEEPRLVFQTGSVEFLASCGFDFNRSFHHGIGYADEPTVERLTNVYDRQVAAASQPEERREGEDINLGELRPYAQDQYRQALTLAQRLADAPADGEPEEPLRRNEHGELYVVLPAFSPFVRRVLYQEVPRNFGDRIHLAKLAEDNPRDPQRRRGDGHLRLTRCKEGSTAEGIQRRAVEAGLSAERAKLAEASGLSLVIAEIKKAKKPLIGHNCLTDFAHLYHKFVRPLPSDLETFRQEFHEAFPMIVDTKHLFLENPELKTRVPMTALGQCFESTASPLFASTNPVIEFPEGFSRYDLTGTGAEALHHEAGYDAFMTGIVFARGLCHLGFAGATFDGTTLVPAKGDKRMSRYMLNRLYLMRLGVSMAMDEPNVEEDRSLLLRLCNFPPATKTWHLQNALQNASGLRRPRVIWDDDTSAFFAAPSSRAFDQVLEAAMAARPAALAGTQTAELAAGTVFSFAHMDTVPYNLWVEHGRSDAKDYRPLLGQLAAARPMGTGPLGSKRKRPEEEEKEEEREGRSNKEPKKEENRAPKASKDCVVM